MFSCPACGSKDGGLFRLCAICKMEATVSIKSKTPIRPIGEAEEDD